MKKILLTAAFALLGATASFAQVAPAPAPTASTKLVTVSASATGFLGSGGAQAATSVTAGLNLTQRFTLNYQQIIIPSSASFKFGEARYSLPFNALVGKKLAAKFLFDTSKVDVEAFGGAGLEQAGGVSHLAETGGLCLGYKLSGSVTYQPVCGQYVHSNLISGVITSPSTSDIATALQISF